MLLRKGENLEPAKRAEFVARIDEAVGEMRAILDAERSVRRG
jgi:hypothetical protein